MGNDGGTVRRALRRDLPVGLLAALPLLIIVGPVLPGLVLAFRPALSSGGFSALAADNQWPQALSSTLTSAIVSTVLALLIALAAVIPIFPGPRWSRLIGRLPLLLSMPHLAFAIGLAFLIAPGGWLLRIPAQILGWDAPPQIVTLHDGFGLSLALGLALKESVFLIWMLASILINSLEGRHLVLSQTLGYHRLAIWRQVILPGLLPKLGWPLAAVFAYGLSVVDVGLVLGPTNPPTLAMLATRMLSDPDLTQQAEGSAIALVLVAIMALTIGLAHLIWALASRNRVWPNGKRGHDWPAAFSHTGPVLVWLGRILIAILILWTLGRSWFFPDLLPDGLTLHYLGLVDWQTLANTCLLGLASAALGLCVTLIWLEWVAPRFDPVITIVLVLPVLPIAAGQYQAVLLAGMDGGFAALVWSHAFWVVPYMILSLAGPYRSLDPRYVTIAKSLGRSRLVACLMVKWPVLAKPIALSFAIGFSVSVAQYLPTLFVGAGRFVTVTMEAALASAGEGRQVVALTALAQMALPLAMFALIALALSLILARRRGLA